MRQRLLAGIILLSVLSLLTGCGRDASSATATEAGTTTPSRTSLTPEQQQRINDIGKAHQTGGRVRSQLMHQNVPKP